jgi:hypothetical protein
MCVWQKWLIGIFAIAGINFGLTGLIAGRPHLF